MPDNEVAGYQGPEYDDVQQFEPTPEMVTVPVSIDQPLNVRNLPAVNSQIFEKAVPATNPATKLTSANEFRGRIIIVSDTDFYLARTKEEAESDRGRIPADKLLELSATSELWAKAITTTAAITIIEESWAW